MSETKQVELTAATLKTVKAKAADGCFLCKRALEAIGPESELRDWPLGADEAEYPVEAQRIHILRETGR